MGSVFGLAWWAKPEWLAVALGIATLAVVFYQVFLMLRQSDMMKYQTTVIEKQDSLLARLPEFKIERHVIERDDGTMGVELRMHNVGTKGVRDFYWHINIPKGRDIRFIVEGRLKGFDARAERTNGDMYEQYSNHIPEPCIRRSRSACASYG